MKKYKLEDCPWCYSDENLYIADKNIFSNIIYFFVECGECHARGTVTENEEQAVEKWNKVMGIVSRYEDEHWSKEAKKGEESGYIGIEESRKLEEDILNAKEEKNKDESITKS